MKDFWDSRYGEQDWAYGKEPNQYFREQLIQLSPGSILLPADGEGRNSVYAANQGWEATAFDLSHTARDKAMKLASEKKVSINYQVGNLSDLDFPENSFDVIALIYAHFPAHLKTDFHNKLITYLKPGGILIFEAFSVDHLKLSAVNPEAGGPKNPDMLFTSEEVQRLFPEFEKLELTQKETELSEGRYHRGLSSVIRFTGRKKA
jgi:SAM-dependent methyltransferase